MTKTTRVATGGTLALGLAVTLAAFAAPPKAKPPKAKKPAVMSMAAMVKTGKTLAETKKCNTCHGADYAGKQGFAPSLRADSRVFTKYDAKTWARVLDTGETEDGGKVKQPMPVYHLAAKDSGALWAYFKTLK